MLLCAAQINPAKGAVDANITLHRKAIACAVRNKAAAIFFPELSLTGYEPQLAEALALQPEDKRLDSFRYLSNAHGITIGVGAPTRHAMGTRISMLVYQPGQQVMCYSKQQLHADELPFFIPGDTQVLLSVANRQIAPAICYESLQPGHAAHASQLGATLYVASVAKPQVGVDKAKDHFPNIAKQYAMPVIMVNCVGHCDDFIAAGGSAAWTCKGTLAGALAQTEEALLFFDTQTTAISVQNSVNW